MALVIRELKSRTPNKARWTILFYDREKNRISNRVTDKIFSSMSQALGWITDLRVKDERGKRLYVFKAEGKIYVLPLKYHDISMGKPFPGFVGLVGDGRE